MQLDIKKIFLCSNIFLKKKLHIVFLQMDKWRNIYIGKKSEL